ncbi:hypothetical protein EV143_10944 [Flavobacterium chryseum]|uniref:hypothetical protein n=1 Tax=Flavobacterium sp. P3160 TaxID=2512113 RepID=UPI001061F37D|nr:hypothetical protein [Flavobacterium sp. P3160]TDO71189.1 hypothetical protein EV143_10944 [Flavobacterium sp. P3160]
MTLTDKHIGFENDCRQIFIGETILEVIYGEIKYYFEDSENIDPEPSYSTIYPDIDTLDHSIYFKTNNKTIYIFWDSTFFSYGLSSKEIDFKVTANDYEQKWDVTNDEKWIKIIGEKIIDFKIIWEEVYTSNMNGTNKMYFTYPQTFQLKMENGILIILSASEFKETEQTKIYGMSDNLLVTTNFDLAKQLEMI